MARGDLLFYTADGSLVSRLISWRTRGPYVHVEVDVGDGYSIGAHLYSGVAKFKTGWPAARFSLRQHTSAQQIDEGVAWLVTRLGSSYSLFDIATFFVPRRYWRIFVTEEHSYDCSHLVTEYLERTGGVNLDQLPDDPSLISPNDLARACGLL